MVPRLIVVIIPSCVRMSSHCETNIMSINYISIKKSDDDADIYWMLGVCHAWLNFAEDFNMINSFNLYTNPRRWMLLSSYGLTKACRNIIWPVTSLISSLSPLSPSHWPPCCFQNELGTSHLGAFAWLFPLLGVCSPDIHLSPLFPPGLCSVRRGWPFLGHLS